MKTLNDIIDAADEESDDNDDNEPTPDEPRDDSDGADNGDEGFPSMAAAADELRDRDASREERMPAAALPGDEWQALVRWQSPTGQEFTLATRDMEKSARRVCVRSRDPSSDSDGWSNVAHYRAQETPEVTND